MLTGCPVIKNLRQVTVLEDGTINLPVKTLYFLSN